MNLVNILQRKNHAEIHLVTNHKKQQSNSMSTFFWVLREYLQTQKGLRYISHFVEQTHSNKRRSKTEYKSIILSNGAMFSPIPFPIQSSYWHFWRDVIHRRSTTTTYQIGSPNWQISFSYQCTSDWQQNIFKNIKHK